MTSTAVMPVRSRSSLRALDSNDTGENSIQPPPSKRPRLNPVPSRRRKSSPDLLDTTIESTPSYSSTSTKLRRPRPLFALSSAHTTSSPPPAGNTPRARNLRLHRHDTPSSTSTTLYLNGGLEPESPDPLDTISPALATLKSAPEPSSTTTPTSAAYRQRRVTQPSKSASEQVIKEPRKSKTIRISRGSTVPALDDSIPQSLTVPAATANRAVPEKRRSLRSHDGSSRAKSELALYFPNYDQVISLEPPKTELLSGNTVIKLIDDLSEPPIPPSTFLNSDTDTPFENPLVNLHKCEIISLPDPPAPSDNKRGSGTGDNDGGDPLNEEFFFKAHRRHERQEKQLRNIERDRAQHEKQQLDRLLDELKSQDWLRVMGITGRSLSDQDKKLYEPKRDYFIKEISALLQKFKIWKEEEKRRKLDKDKTSSFHTDAPEYSHTKEIEKDEEEDVSEPPPDDVDALAARQLLQEARSATAGKRPKVKSEPELQPELPPAAEPSKPFLSFFAKPRLREQAMSGNLKGRSRLAFGQPIPDVEEKDFELPGDILTPEAIKSCQRKRRRMKRASLG